MDLYVVEWHAGRVQRSRHKALPITTWTATRQFYSEQKNTLYCTVSLAIIMK
jgi:hypothetical protein